MRPEFKYGLIIGVGLGLWLFLEHSLGLHIAHQNIGVWTGYLSNLVPTTALFLLLRQKQLRATDHRFTPGQAIVSGMLASFLGAMIVFVFQMAYNRWIGPDWIDNALAVKVAVLRAHEISEDAIRRAITLFRQANSPVGLIIGTVINQTVTGGIISAAIAVLLIRQKKITTENTEYTEKIR
ncbi:MAG TPA: DUF4199 domain-containing protein [Lacunisphaera sp.]|jgi:hypothetical protein